MNSYELTRPFWDWAYENPEKIKPVHIAVFNFAIEHCNRMGWKQKFGFPSQMTMEAIGVKSYKTYVGALTDLVDWGFIKMIEKSRNQYSANIIELVKYTKATTKALDKALPKHGRKQPQSIASIDKPINKETIKLVYRKFAHLNLSLKEFDNLNKDYTKTQIDEILDSIENFKNNTNYTSLNLTARKWLKKEYPKVEDRPSINPNAFNPVN